MVPLPHFMDGSMTTLIFLQVAIIEAAVCDSSVDLLVDFFIPTTHVKIA